MLIVSKALGDGIKILKEHPVIFIPFTVVGILNYWLLSLLASILTTIINEWPFLSSLFTQQPSLTKEGLINELINYFGENFLSSFDNAQIIGNVIAFGAWLCSVFGIILILQAHQNKINTKDAGLMFIKKILPLYISFALNGAFVAVVAIGVFLIAFLGIGLISLIGLIISSVIVSAIALLLIGIVITLGIGIIIFVSLKLMYFIQATLLDNQGIIECLKMSWRVTRDAWWKNAYLASIFSLLNLFILLLLPLGFILGFTQIAIIVYSILIIVISALAVASFSFAYIQLRDSTLKGGDMM